MKQMAIKYPEQPPMIISLGVSENSNGVHDKILKNMKVKNTFYIRIDYLKLQGEDDTSYYNKIKKQAQNITNILFQNYELGNVKATPCDLNI
jgi:hypothetical protein